jgi:hypothetical protein
VATAAELVYADLTARARTMPNSGRRHRCAGFIAQNVTLLRLAGLADGARAWSTRGAGKAPASAAAAVVLAQSVGFRPAALRAPTACLDVARPINHAALFTNPGGTGGVRNQRRALQQDCRPVKATANWRPEPPLPTHAVVGRPSWAYLLADLVAAGDARWRCSARRRHRFALLVLAEIERGNAKASGSPMPMMLFDARGRARYVEALRRRRRRCA